MTAPMQGETGAAPAVPGLPSLSAAAALEDATPFQRAGIREAILAFLPAWRHDVEVIANAAAGPDPEIAATYLADALRSLMRDLPALDAALRAALQAEPVPLSIVTP